MINASLLKSIMPNLKDSTCDLFLPCLQHAMEEFEITSGLREAAFLAQVAHESGEFRFMEEIWGPTAAQRAYEPPGRKATRLGNTQRGDGKRFKGRGPIQITGRANYRRYGTLLGVDLLADPALAATPEIGCRIAGAYWRTHGLNPLADRQEFEEITRRINGGLNGLADRLRFYERAKRLLVA